MMPTQEASPEELEVGNGLGVVTHGVAELDHGLAEVGQAVGVHLEFAGLHAYRYLSSSAYHLLGRCLGTRAAQLPNVINDSQCLRT